MNQVSDLESNDHATVSQTLAQCSMNTVHAPTSALIRVPLIAQYWISGLEEVETQGGNGRKWEEMGGNGRKW